MTELDPKAAAERLTHFAAGHPRAYETQPHGRFDKPLKADIRTLLKALAASQQQGPEIKGLEWETEKRPQYFKAVGILGWSYALKVESDRQVFLFSDGDFDGARFVSVEAAKAAAQADYEARIRTALAPSVGAEEPTRWRPAPEDIATMPADDTPVEVNFRTAKEIEDERLSRAPSPHKGEPVATELQKLFAEMGTTAIDPMWADHVELQKVVLQRWIKTLRPVVRVQAPIPEGMVLLPDELNGEMWLAGRRVFEDEAERFRATTTTAMAMAIADRAPEKIFAAIIAAATPAPQAEPGAGE